MHLVLEEVQDVMAFPLLPWDLIGFEPERASQVVLIKPIDRCLTSFGRPSGPQQCVSYLKTPGWIHVFSLVRCFIQLGMVSHLHLAFCRGSMTWPMTT